MSQERRKMLVVNFRTVRVTIDPFSSRCCCNGPGGGSSSSSTSVLAAAAVDRSFSTEIEPGCSRSMADARVRCLEKTLSSSRKGHSQCNHLCLLVLFFLLLLRKTGFWYTRLSRGPRLRECFSRAHGPLLPDIPHTGFGYRQRKQMFLWSQPGLTLPSSP